MGEAIIAKRREVKDLWLLIQDNLEPEKHIKQIFDSTYRILSDIRVAFHYMDKEMMNKIMTCVVRPRLEYAAVVWSLYEKRHQEIGEDLEDGHKNGARVERPKI